MKTDDLHQELRKCRAFMSLALCLLLAHFAASFTLPQLPQKNQSGGDTHAVWAASDSGFAQQADRLVGKSTDPTKTVLSYITKIRLSLGENPGTSRVEPSAWEFVGATKFRKHNPNDTPGIDFEKFEPMGFGKILPHRSRR